MNKNEADYSKVIPTYQTVINNSPNLPWTTLGHVMSCNRINSYASPVISFEIDFQLSNFNFPAGVTKNIIHIMLDSGANVSFITRSCLKDLGLTRYIVEAGQLAMQADGETKLQVLGEFHMIVTRKTGKNEILQFPFHALVVNKLNNCDMIGGMNFLIENQIDLLLSKRKVKVLDKYYLEETPSLLANNLSLNALQEAESEKYPYKEVTELCHSNAENSIFHIPKEQVIQPRSKPRLKESPEKLLSLKCSPLPISLIKSPLPNSDHSPHHMYSIRTVGVLWPDESLKFKLPSHFDPDSDMMVEPRIENKVNDWLPQVVTANDGVVEIFNLGVKPVIYGKGQDTQFIQVRALSAINTEIICQTNAFPTRSDANEMEPVGKINEIQVNISEFTSNQLSKLASIHEKYNKVFNKDLRSGVNPSLSSSVCDWNWAAGCKPPSHVSKVPIYSNRQEQLVLQDKIDWMFNNNICDVYDSSKYGPLEFCTPCMLVPKAPARGKQNLTHEDYRFVQLHNKQNDWISTQPARSVNIPDALYDIGQWNYIIETDLFHGFWQRRTAQDKLPQSAFHSPFKGTFVMLRGSQGRKNESEQLDEWLYQVMGDLIQQGKVLKLHDDIRIGGRSVDEALENYSHVLERFAHHNIKLHPKKTKIFPKSTTVFGFVKEGQILKPSDHTILSISKTPLPKTNTQLRGFLGQFKTFLKHVPNTAIILGPLEKFVAKFRGKNEPLLWDTATTQSFNQAKREILNRKNLYLPKRSDQLAQTHDWSKEGIGATLFAIFEKEHLVVSYFSQSNEGNMRDWPPCDGEAAAGAAGVNFNKHYIREALKPTILLFDNRTVVQAANILAKGAFSVGRRLNALLACINNFNVTIQHLSGKLGLNPHSDLQSRMPTPGDHCPDNTCNTCKFLRNIADSLDAKVLKQQPIAAINILKQPEVNEANDIKDIISGKKTLKFMSHSAIKQLQSEDEELMRVDFYLRSGNRALAKDNKCPYVKRYMNSPHAVRTDDGLLVVHRKVPHSVISAEVPIIPRSMAQAILTSCHIKLFHPLPTQMKKAMDRYCYSLDQDKIIDEIWNHCHLCQSLKKIPKEIPHYDPSPPPAHPGTHWAADVMKYGKKCVLVATDNLSSFTVATIARSERHEHMQEAIITAISPFRSMALQTEVRVDTAPGLAKLTREKSLLKYGMKLDPGQAKNKDSCAKVDKAMSELRRELEVLNPVERTLTTEDLCLAVANLNSRIRHSGLSAREIMFQRSQTTDENIHLEDKNLQESTELLRTKNLQYSAKSKSNQSSKSAESARAEAGNLVYLKGEKEKGSSRHLYIVTKIGDDSKLYIRKILHSLEQFPIKLRPEEYVVRQEDVYLAPNQPKHPVPIHTMDKFKYDPPLKSKPMLTTLPIKLRLKKLRKQTIYSHVELFSSDTEDDDKEPITKASKPLTRNQDEHIDQNLPETETSLESELNENNHDLNNTIRPRSESEGGDVLFEPTDDEATDQEKNDSNVSIVIDTEESNEHESESNEDDADIEDLAGIPEVELNNMLIQTPVPKKGDVVDIFSQEHQEWYSIKLYTNRLKGYPYEYNCIFPDGSRGSVCLKPGQLWSIQTETSEHNEQESPPEDIHPPNDHPIENLRDENKLGQITPGAMSENESEQLTVSENDDVFIDDNYSDQPSVASIDDEIDRAFNFLNRAFSVSAHPNLDLPPDMSIERNKVYNLTSVLNIDIPTHGTFVDERTYLLPQELSYHLLYRRNPLIDDLSPDPNARQRFKFLPKFVRRLNPFRKK